MGYKCISSNSISSNIKGLSLITYAKEYQKAIAKDIEIEKYTCKILCFDSQVWQY